MKLLLISLAFFLSLAAPAQKLLEGVVVDANQKPVPNASIFLNNTSLGTRAGTDGRFKLYIPPGRFELIVSSVGFETYNKTITADEIASFISIQLKIKAPELEAIVVEPFEKDGWKKWGRFFLESFIGTSDASTQCSIKNPGVLRFRYSKKDGQLTVVATEPLLIQNKALGYTLHYQLENFTYSFSNRYLLFVGYPYFEPMQGSKSRQAKWERNRQDAYEGSMMHFMRSVYRNKLAEEGFEVQRLHKIANAEKQRVKEVERRLYPQHSKKIAVKIDADSAEYYAKVRRQPDFFDVVNNTLLTGDSIAYMIDSFTAGMSFPNYLMVTYKNKLVPPEYKIYFPANGTAMSSQITLLNQPSIQIQYNGSYYDPENVLSLGYWAWSEKVAALLPFDYRTGSLKKAVQ